MPRKSAAATVNIYLHRTRPLWHTGRMKLSASDFPVVPYMTMHDVHLEEIEMINEIYDLIIEIESGKNKGAVLNKKLDAFLEHTRNHFAEEERMMREARFAPYTMHKSAHDKFLSELIDTIQAWHQSREIGTVDQFMRFKLPRWMKDHISTMDYVTAGFLASRSGA